MQELGKLTEFLASYATWPYLYILATTPSARHWSADGSGGIKGSGVPAALAPEARSSLTDFPEGRALVVLETWATRSVHLTLMAELSER